MENTNPWSKIGQDVKGETNVQNALVKAGLDWNVKKVPMFFNGIDGVTTISDNFLNIRKDNQKQLGVVGNRYQIIQNTEAFEFMDRLFENHELEIDNCGSMNGGKRVWLQAKVPETIEIIKGDPIEKYVLIYNSHDGSSGMGVCFTPLRIWCSNMLRSTVKGAKRKIVLKHTPNFRSKLNEAQEILGVTTHYYNMFVEEMKYLSERIANTEITKIFVDRLIPLSESKQEGSINRTRQARHDLHRLVESGRGTSVKGVRGTTYGLYNAAVEYAQYNKRVKGKDLSEVDKVSKRMISMTFDGSLDKFCINAEKLALEAANGTLFCF